MVRGFRPGDIGSGILVAKSCARCHILKDASEYFRMRRGTDLSHQSYCKPCGRKAMHEANRRANDRSRVGATAAFQGWGKEELRKLETLVQKGVTTPEIAKFLNRSIASIHMTKLRYGIYKIREYFAKPGAEIDMSFIREQIEELV